MATRRQHGEGTVFQRNGRWGAAVPLPHDGTGKRRRLWRLVPPNRPNTEEEAQKLRLRMVKEVAAGQHDPPPPAPPAPPEAPTFEAWLATWYAQVEPELAPGTRVRYSEMMRLHVVPHLGSYRLDHLTAEQVATMLVALRKRLAPSTLGLVLWLVRSALRLAVEWEILGRNVATRVKPPRVDLEERPALSEEQARKLLELAAGGTFEAVIMLAMCGLRRGEILGLRWGDLDLDRRKLRVVVQAPRIGTELVPGQPLKTRSSRRTITLPPMVARALIAQRDRQRIDRAAAGDAWPPHDLVVSDRRGEPVRIGWLDYRWRKTRKEIGAPEMHFHDLRHSAASLLAAAGVDPRTIAAILGHTGLNMTGRYLHASEATMEHAATALNTALGG